MEGAGKQIQPEEEALYQSGYGGTFTANESFDYETCCQDVNQQRDLRRQGQELLTLVLQNKSHAATQLREHIELKHR